MADVSDYEELIATRRLHGLDDDLFKEDKIEVNEYVRTDYGEIHKVVHVVEDDGDWNYYRYENTMGDFHMSIVKHSKQLIDLIECEDFVNGYKVISVDYDVMNDTTECIELDLNSNYQYNFISIRQIKTILTHEQFEANCYKVGGEDEF